MNQELEEYSADRVGQRWRPEDHEYLRQALREWALVAERRAADAVAEKWEEECWPV